MKSQSPSALADMFTIIAAGHREFTLGRIARSLLAPLPALAVATLGRIARCLLAPLPALAVATLGSAECLPYSLNPSSSR